MWKCFTKLQPRSSTWESPIVALLCSIIGAADTLVRIWELVSKLVLRSPLVLTFGRFYEDMRLFANLFWAFWKIHLLPALWFCVFHSSSTLLCCLSVIWVLICRWSHNNEVDQLIGRLTTMELCSYFLGGLVLDLNVVCSGIPFNHVCFVTFVILAAWHLGTDMMLFLGTGFGFGDLLVSPPKLSLIIIKIFCNILKGQTLKPC